VILAFPAAIVKMFNSESTELIKIAGKGLMIYFSAMPFVAINVVSVVYLQSIEKSLPALMITLCRTIGFILIGLMVLPRYFGITGVWMIVPLAELTSTLIAVSYMKFKKALR
ncbi:MAG: MATE family efflux transporter, partial [Candidatus Cloacimonetes bacterium]|nr:MATE family efflux transporter [Candidatus Cloacimonadota bacterium]